MRVATGEKRKRRQRALVTVRIISSKRSNGNESNHQQRLRFIDSDHIQYRRRRLRLATLDSAQDLNDLSPLQNTGRLVR